MGLSQLRADESFWWPNCCVKSILLEVYDDRQKSNLEK